MTVAQLIMHLERLPPDAQVVRPENAEDYPPPLIEIKSAYQQTIATTHPDETVTVTTVIVVE